MPGRTNQLLRLGTLALLAFLTLTGDALAYVGPVPGAEFIGYFVTLVGWVAVALSSILLWPIHALVRRWRKAPREEALSPSAPPSEGAPEPNQQHS